MSCTQADYLELAMHASYRQSLDQHSESVYPDNWLGFEFFSGEIDQTDLIYRISDRIPDSGHERHDKVLGWWIGTGGDEQTRSVTRRSKLLVTACCDIQLNTTGHHSTGRVLFSENYDFSRSMNFSLPLSENDLTTIAFVHVYHSTQSSRSPALNCTSTTTCCW